MVKLLSYERFEGANPSVVATVALEIDDLRIYNCRLYQNASGTRWIAPPSRPVKSRRTSKPIDVISPSAAYRY